MVTTSPIPDEANEPPEPRPSQALCASPINTGERIDSTAAAGVHKGGPVSGPEAASSQGSPIPAPSAQEGTQSLDREEKTVSGTAPSSSPIAYDDATDQSKYSPAGASAVLSKQHYGEKYISYQGVDAHYFSPLEVARYLGVDLEDGLSTQDAKARLARDGPNKLEGDEGVGVWRVLVRQVSNSLTLK
ncbi:hypothetical protein BDZ91DRAFT_328052 [Kalaharituber pfeilii]|nr:hypothetical protein BDZ91DRAFT_328052 [Kalaharituber pfeilii]